MHLEGTGGCLRPGSGPADATASRSGNFKKGALKWTSPSPSRTQVKGRSAVSSPDGLLVPLGSQGGQPEPAGTLSFPRPPAAPGCPPAACPNVDGSWVCLFFFFFLLFPHLRTTADRVKSQRINAQTRNKPKRPFLWLRKPRTEELRDACAKLTGLIFGHELEALLDNHLLLFSTGALSHRVSGADGIHLMKSAFCFTFVIQRAA